MPRSTRSQVSLSQRKPEGSRRRRAAPAAGWRPGGNPGQTRPWRTGGGRQVGERVEGAVDLRPGGLRQAVHEEDEGGQEDGEDRQAGKEGARELAPDVLAGGERRRPQELAHPALGVAEARHAGDDGDEEDDEEEAQERQDEGGLEFRG